MSAKMRPQRVAELVRQEIASLLTKGLKDPRIGFVSIMGVRMSADLRYANVYVSLFGSESERKSSLTGLRNSAGWVRRELGKRLRIRYTPEIRFFPDESLDQVYHLEEVFDEIHEQQREAPMLGIGLAEAADTLRGAERFLLTTHQNPDGDAIGSLLGVYHLLRAMGKTEIHCFVDDPVPRTYTNLPGAQAIARPAEEPPEYDLAVVVDVAHAERTGAVADCLLPGKAMLILDHHLGEGERGAMGVIDSSYAAAGEIVVALFAAAGVPISPEAAHCLYVAQITDTGGYRFSNTNARSHRIAAELLEAGVAAAEICCEVFECISRPQFELLRLVLDRMELEADGRVAHTWVAAQDLEAVGARKEDVNNLVNYARNIEGVEVGVLFNGLGPASTKVSLRARKHFDAATFLAAYGGGGHAAAAGATIEQPLAELARPFIDHLCASLELPRENEQEKEAE